MPELHDEELLADWQRLQRGQPPKPIALHDPELFRQVRIDPEVHTIVWPNGADFDPATLHDWPEHAAGFAQKAEEWARKAEPSASHR